MKEYTPCCDGFIGSSCKGIEQLALVGSYTIGCSSPLPMAVHWNPSKIPSSARMKLSLSSRIPLGSSLHSVATGEFSLSLTVASFTPNVEERVLDSSSKRCVESTLGVSSRGDGSSFSTRERKGSAEGISEWRLDGGRIPRSRASLHSYSTGDYILSCNTPIVFRSS